MITAEAAAQVKLKPINSREALCQYMGWEWSECGEHRYHYGRTSAPIYSTSDGYVCAVATGRKPPKYDGLSWKEADGDSARYCKSRGKTIFIASGEIHESDD